MTASAALDLLAPPPAPRAPGYPVIFCHVDIADAHPASGALACLSGWIVAEHGFAVTSLALLHGDGTAIRCNYPFYRGDTQRSIDLAGAKAMTGFNLLLPESVAVDVAALGFVVFVAADEAEPRPYTFTVPRATGQTHKLVLTTADRLGAPPAFVALPEAPVGELLEQRLFGHLARRRQLTLRLDLVNKCNLRCVMCHYSNDDFARRPAQRITPAQFAAFFEPIAPVTRDVMLSCGDEPLMSPHFETILRDIAARDPEVRIRFCTNGMLLTEKIAAAIVAARVHMVLFSFDGVCSQTLHRIRVGSDFSRIIRNIVHLRRRRAAAGGARPDFVFNFVMLESNIHEAPAFVEVARQLGGSCIDFRHVVPFDFYDIEHEMLEHFKPKYNHYRAGILAAAAAAGINVYLPPPFETAATYDPSGDPAVSLDEFRAVLGSLGPEPAHDAPRVSPADATAAARPTLEIAHLFCDRPFNEVMIRDQRDVYPCAWHREKMGTLDGSTSLEEIFFGENFRRVRRAMLSPDGAPGCSHCPIKSKFLPTEIL